MKTWINDFKFRNSTTDTLQNFDPFQKKILNEWDTCELNCMPACRQAGSTLMALAHVINQAVAQPLRIIYIAGNRGNATIHVQLFKDLFELNVTHETISELTTNSVKLSNGSDIRFITGQPSGYMGQAANRLYVDVGQISNETLDEVVHAIRPTLSNSNIKPKLVFFGCPQEKLEIFDAIDTAMTGNKMLGIVPNNVSYNKVTWNEVPWLSGQFKENIIKWCPPEVFEKEFELCL